MGAGASVVGRPVWDGHGTASQVVIREEFSRTYFLDSTSYENSYFLCISVDTGEVAPDFPEKPPPIFLRLVGRSRCFWDRESWICLV